MSHQATPPNNHIMRAIASNPLFRKIPSVGFLKAFMGEALGHHSGGGASRGVNSHHPPHMEEDEEEQGGIGLSTSPGMGGRHGRAGGRQREEDEEERTALRFAEDGDEERDHFGLH